MIEVIIGVGLVWWLSGKGDKAVKSGVRSAKRTAADVASKAETVLQPCAHGLGEHRWPSERQQARIAARSDGNGIHAVSCLVCGQEKT